MFISRSSHGLRREAVLFFLVAALILAPLITPLQSVHAAPTFGGKGNATWASWYMVADFSQNQLNVQWTSYVGFEEKGRSVVTDIIEHDISRNCRLPVGNVGFSGGYVLFEGGYIECDTPDFQADIAQMAPHLSQAINPTCECKTGGAPFWISADMVVNDIRGDHAPIFYKEDFGLYLKNRDFPNVAVRTHFVHDRTQSYTDSSHDWQVDSRGNTLWLGNGGGHVLSVSQQMGWSQHLDSFYQNGRVQNVLNDLNTNASLFEWAQDSDGNPVLSKEPVGFPMNHQFSLKTEPDVVYIGFDPATGATLDGAIRIFEADPGCKGH